MGQRDPTDLVAELGQPRPPAAAQVGADAGRQVLDQQRDETAGPPPQLGAVYVYDPIGSTGSRVRAGARSQAPGRGRAPSGLAGAASPARGGLGDADFWYAAALKLLAPLLFAAATSARWPTSYAGSTPRTARRSRTLSTPRAWRRR
jgi:hypothetical protein